MSDDEEFERHLDTILIGGQERREIVVVPYDPGWPVQFEQERRRIRRALGDEALAVHHIGSTAVPGLAAKPIIDMALEVRRPGDEATYVAALEAAGYELRVREPDHRMLRTTAKDVHLHCWTEPADLERHILFRDWLRAHDIDRRRYEDLKRHLAAQDWPDMNHYARAKSALIEEICARAREAQGGGVPPLRADHGTPS